MSTLRERPQNPIFLISPPISAGHREKLLGACVADPYKPTDAYSKAPRRPIDILPEINPDPVPIDNYRSILNASSNDSVRAKLESVVNVFFERGNDSEEARSAATAQWWMMETPQDHFRDLMGDRGYRDSVLKLMNTRKGEPVYLVTNVLVLSAPQIDKTKKSSRKAGAQAGVPDPHTNGLTKVIDVGTEVGRTGEKLTSGQFRNEMIVGLGVYEVYLSKRRPSIWTCGMFQRYNPDPIIAAPIPDRLLYDLRMGRSLAQPRDGAHFMSGDTAHHRKAHEIQDETPAGFVLYFPQ